MKFDNRTERTLNIAISRILLKSRLWSQSKNHHIALVNCFVARRNKMRILISRSYLPVM